MSANFSDPRCPGDGISLERGEPWRFNTEDTEVTHEDVFPELSSEIIRCAMQVHSTLGPGLLEAAYEHCLCREFSHRGLLFQRQKAFPLLYRETRLDCGFRVDLLVESKAIVEVKAIDTLLPVHHAQLLTYLRLAHCRLGLLINFNVPHLREGIRRRVL